MEAMRRTAVLTVLVEPSRLEELRADAARWSAGRARVEEAGKRLADVPLAGA